MASNFGTRDEVRDATQDIWLFQIDFTDRKLGRDIRIVGAVLPLKEAPIKAPIKAPIVLSQTTSAILSPRYKALAAVCLAGLIAGTGAIALMANTGVNNCERNRLTSIE